jgi:hypothetical protein
MTDNPTALVLAGLVGFVVSALFFFTMLGRAGARRIRGRLASDKPNARTPITSYWRNGSTAKGRENVRLDQALKAAASLRPAKKRIAVCRRQRRAAGATRRTNRVPEKEALFARTGALEA